MRLVISTWLYFHLTADQIYRLYELGSPHVRRRDEAQFAQDQADHRASLGKFGIGRQLRDTMTMAKYVECWGGCTRDGLLYELAYGVQDELLFRGHPQLLQVVSEMTDAEPCLVIVEVPDNANVYIDAGDETLREYVREAHRVWG